MGEEVNACANNSGDDKEEIFVYIQPQVDAAPRACCCKASLVSADVVLFWKF